MNRKIWKALGIAVCMLALAAPRAMAETHRVGSEKQFKDAVEAINKPGDAKNEIILTQDITLGGDPTQYTLYTLSRGETTIKGGGNKITISNAGITVAKKGTVLNLGEKGYKGTLTIDGKTSGGFVSVLEGATANMYENVTLQNWTSAGYACVVIMGSDPVTGSKSVFNMYGGVIENCSRAVMADSGTTFNMYGGEIRNREGSRGSGVHVFEATFVMSGGTISGCTANEGGGLYATNQSTITISGGTISGCKAPSSDKGNGSGLYANKSTINISGGTISGCEGRWGGGLYAENSSTIEISGGTISGCKVGAGGGLFVDSSTIRISGGIISECTTSDTGNGGGLYAKNSTIKITGGRIENNKAALGGGVALIGDTTFEKPITNWTVIGNEAYATGGVGGGIKLENGSMDVSDGSNRIYNNTADGHGADICLEGGASSIKLPNAANMGAKYHDSGIKIDGWYKDDNPRYRPSKDGKPVENLQLSGPLSLVASYTVIPMCTVTIDANGGVGGSVSQTVQKGTNVTLEAPTKEGHLFTGWKDEKGNSYPAGEDGKVKITVTGDMTLTAEWKKLPSAENLPKTGDESPVLLWGTALAVSAVACFMLRRRK